MATLDGDHSLTNNIRVTASPPPAQPPSASSRNPSLLVGVDVGGTFTDLILLDAATGHQALAKVPTTPDNQAFGVLAAIAAAGVPLAGVAAIVHGTTTTTNAVLERKLARVGLITTRGFRDVLELGRRTRPNPYGLTGRFEPIVPRELRLEVAERISAEGEVLTPLDEAELRAAIARLLSLGAESLVIHFLHAYANPAHEQRAGAIARALWPNPWVTLGHEVLSEFREYERGVTAAVNAAVRPVLQRYLDRLTAELAARGFERELMVMQGNGGTIGAGIAAEQAVNTVMSGPASGVIAAARSGALAGFPDLVTYDMGGTSSDVGLIRGGLPAVSAELDLEYAMPIHVPMVDVHTIGAGGGSIARVDAAGMLRVGPESAGARPGPICYGHGGSEPTITDANLVLGRLDPERLLSVAAPVSVAAVRAVIAERIGRPLGLDGDEAAAAILRIANDRMAGAIRMMSLARGHDPRDFALFAFGGAGPLHAVALARELAIPHVLVPARPGITNAIGCLVADLRHDFVRTLNLPLSRLDIGQATAILAEQAEEGRWMLAREGVGIEAIEIRHEADMQFQGQTHLLTVPVDAEGLTVAGLAESFAAAYWRRFEVALPEIRPVLVNLHTIVLGRRRPVALDRLLDPGRRAASLDGARIGSRRVWFPGGWQDTPVYDRERLPEAAVLSGPAVLHQLDCTTVIDPGAEARVDSHGNLVVRT
ncbi:MAG: hydantoinase/oxoprolinase family protein [Thalassobaculales bacterium]